MANKQPEVTARTRARLRHAFWELYAVKPIEKISVREITERAGYNRATFYLHYQSVYDLLHQIEDELLSHRRHLFEGLEHTDPTAIPSTHLPNQEELERQIQAFVAVTKRDAPYLAVLLGPHGDAEFLERIKNVDVRLIAMYAGVPATAAPTATTREYVREFYVSGLLAVMRKWLADPNAMPIEQFVRFLIEAFFPVLRDARQGTHRPPAESA